MNKDFTYCKGNDCTLKKHCVRYVDGKKIPDDAKDYWWMMDCGDGNTGYIETKQ